MRRAWVFFALLAFAGRASAVDVGDSAPNAALSDRTGGTGDIAGRRGKVVLLNFWATWCAPCHLEFPELAKLSLEFETDAVEIVQVSVDSDRANVEKFLRKKSAASRATLAFDPKGKAAEAFGVQAMPSSFVIDRRGVVRHVHLGYQPEDRKKWRKEIADLLREEER